MFKLITDRKTAQEAIAKVKEALTKKSKEQKKDVTSHLELKE